MKSLTQYINEGRYKDIFDTSEKGTILYFASSENSDTDEFVVEKPIRSEMLDNDLVRAEIKGKKLPVHDVMFWEDDRKIENDTIIAKTCWLRGKNYENHGYIALSKEVLTAVLEEPIKKELDEIINQMGELQNKLSELTTKKATLEKKLSKKIMNK